MAEKVVGYRLKITGTKKTVKEMGMVADELRAVIELTKKLEKALQEMGSGGGGNELAGKMQDLLKAMRETAEMPDPMDPEQMSQSAEEIQRLIEKFDELRKNGKDYAKELREIRKVLKSGAVDGTKAFDQLAERAGKLKARQDDVNQTIRDQARNYKETNKFAEGSYRQLQAELGRLRSQWRDLSKEEREANTGLIERIAEVDQELKALDDEMGLYFRNVGNYTSAFDEVKELLTNLPGPIGQVQAAFKALSKNPILFVVGALITLLTKLFEAFKSTAAGVALMDRAGAALEASFAVLIDIADALAKAFLGAFTDPLGALRDMGKAIVDQITTRLKGAWDTVMGLGNALLGLATGDLERVKKAANDTGEAMTNMVTGTTQEQRQQLVDDMNKLADSFENGYNQLVNLAQAQRIMRRTNRALSLEMKELQEAIDLASAAANDNTLSLEEQRAAADESMQLQQRQAQMAIQIAQNNLAIAREQQAANANDVANAGKYADAVADAMMEVMDAERELTMIIDDNATRRREIRQDQAELELDVLIDGLNNQAQINFNQIRDEEMTVKRRRALLDETVRISQGSFDEQIKILNEFAKNKIDGDELLAASDARTLNALSKQTGLSEALRKRLLEVVRDRRDLEEEFSEFSQFLDQEAQREIQEGIEQQFADRQMMEKIKLEEGIITREEFNVRQIELERQQIEAELAELELGEQKRLELRRQYDLLELEQNKANFERDKAQIQQRESEFRLTEETAFLERQTFIEELFAQGQITDAERQERLAEAQQQNRLAQLESERQFLLERAALLESFGLSTIEIEKRIAANELAITKQKNKEQIEDERRTAELTQQINNARIGILGDLVSATSDLLGKDEENRKKYAGVLKALAIGEVAINLLREISAINANPAVNTDLTQTLRTTLIAAAVVRAGIATGKILTQEFAQGGAIEFEQGGATTGSQGAQGAQSIGIGSTAKQGSGANTPLRGPQLPSTGLSQVGQYGKTFSPKEGVLSGPTHSQGGISFVDSKGNLYEAEGGEMLLRNGKEYYFINRQATRQNLAALQGLIGKQGPEKRVIASAINQSTGGVKFAQGGVVSLGRSVQAVRPAQPQRLNSIATLSDEATQAITEQGRVIERVVERTSGQGAEPTMVYADPRQIYRIGKKRSSKVRRL